MTVLPDYNVNTFYYRNQQVHQMISKYDKDDFPYSLRRWRDNQKLNVHFHCFVNVDGYKKVELSERIISEDTLLNFQPNFLSIYDKGQIPFSCHIVKFLKNKAEIEGVWLQKVFDKFLTVHFLKKIHVLCSSERMLNFRKHTKKKA
jgi:hypothetical protein